MDTPPAAATYQLTVPALTVAAKSNVPVPHLESGAVVSTVGDEVTVAITAVREVEAQAPFKAST